MDKKEIKKLSEKAESLLNKVVTCRPLNSSKYVTATIMETMILDSGRIIVTTTEGDQFPADRIAKKIAYFFTAPAR
ncbi:hypothetical protein ACFL1N_11175 [Thermodesulfobacteriota bacterium]